MVRTEPGRNAKINCLFSSSHIAARYSLFMSENENENGTKLILKGNSYRRRKSIARGPRSKVSSEGLSTEIDILLRSPIQVLSKTDVA